MIYIIVLISILMTQIYAAIPSEMMAYVDPSINPCHDFYHYACGNWIKQTILPPTKTHIDSSFEVVDTHNTEIIMKIINDKHPIVSELWDSCLALDTITKLGNTQLKDDLDRLDRAQKTSQVIELAGEFARTGTDSFLKVIIGPDPLDTKHFTIELSDAKLSLSSNDYFQDFIFIKEKYQNYINNVFTLATSKKRKRSSSHSMDEIIINFERHLAMIDKTVRSKVHPMTFSKAIETWPIVYQYLKGMKILENHEIQSDLIIYVQRPEYITSIQHLIDRVSIDELKLYIAYRMIHSRVLSLGQDFYTIWYKFFKGQSSIPPTRTSFCREQLITYLPDLMGHHFYKKAFHKNEEEKILEMIRLLQDAMKERIHQSKWMIEKEEAKKKINEVLPLVGQSKVPPSYPSVSVLSRDDYSTNVQILLSYSFNQQIKKIGQPVDRHVWTESSATSNAYYNPMRNTMMIPAGVLQSPLFHGSNVHPARNFGAIGTIMGHELTHGFDTIGRLYNAQGNAAPWWSLATQNGYESNADCFAEQYSAFQVNGEHVDGELTLNENIADNGGVTIAWDAYRNYMIQEKYESNGVTKEEGDQMFFLAYGQTYCEKFTDEMMQEHLATDEHSPGQWRVNGVVMNNKNFAKVFNCKGNTPMNPINKCNIW